MAERGFLTVRGVWLSWLDFGGDGHPLLSLHGRYSCARTFVGFAHALAGRWRVVALDQRGHGWSDVPDDYSRQVKALLPPALDPNYQRTRGLHKRLGFQPLRETPEEGDANPYGMVVEHLSASSEGAAATSKSQASRSLHRGRGRQGRARLRASFLMPAYPTRHSAVSSQGGGR
ncbi:MAG: alpha/beta hydrolase [Thermotogota bacterium]